MSMDHRLTNEDMIIINGEHAYVIFPKIIDVERLVSLYSNHYFVGALLQWCEQKQNKIFEINWNNQIEVKYNI